MAVLGAAAQNNAAATGRKGVKGSSRRGLLRRNTHQLSIFIAQETNCTRNPGKEQHTSMASKSDATLLPPGERAVSAKAIARGFFNACRDGRDGLVRIFLELEGDRAVDVNANNDAAFRAAVRHGNTCTAKILLELEGDRAVDVTANNDEAMRWAVFDSDTVMVKMLLARGAKAAPGAAAQT